VSAIGGATTSAEVDARLQLALGWTFKDHSLLDRALTHRSFCSENNVEASNERLEFLGDSVLGFVVTTFVYDEYPALPEGELAKLRATVVSAETLAEVANEIDLGAALRLGKGEDSSGGRAKSSILADAMEAVIAAVYLDGGLEPAARVVLASLESRIREQAIGPGGGDYKTRLQELTQRVQREMPAYTLVEERGPDHEKEFVVELAVGGRVLGRGVGRSKKLAEQAAAMEALAALTSSQDGD